MIDVGSQLVTIGELNQTSSLYKKNKEEWKRYDAAFQGIKAIIDRGYIEKHERELDDEYQRRIKELYGFGYSSSVVRILNFFLFKKPPQRKIESLNKEQQWGMFWEDCDLKGNDWDTLLRNTIMLYSSILGHMGILIDKSPIEYPSIQQEKINNVYPYIAVYYPLSILDWEFKKDENNRPYLAYVKLLDDDGQYRLWSTEKWAVYRIPEEKTADTDTAELVASGVNKLKFIPFFWHYNMRSKNRGIGISDLNEIARLDISIIKNASQLEEIINYAAFPMMIKPRRDANPKEVSTQQQVDEVSVKSVLEYDPEYPESKPDWLTPEVEEAVKAILDTINFKVSEIYRTANIGGLASTEVQTQAKSGVALQTEFQMLNSEIISKAINLEKTENKIAEYWLKWQKLWDRLKDQYSFGRPRTYDIENLAADLENAITAKSVVISKTFNSLLQKRTARQILPTISETDLDTVDKEIDESVDRMEEPDPLKEETDEDTKIINEGMSEE